jgi:GNAT superfamily N-acetyltransferase
MIVRPARPEDAGAMARLRWEFRSAVGQPEETAGAFVERCRQWMSERLAGGGSWRGWVAEEDGQIVGTIWLNLIEKLPNPGTEPEHHAYVSSVYVRPAFRRKGTGSALLAAALDACRGLEVDAVILWPTQESRSLYARHGFAVRDDLMERRQ